MLKKKLTVGRDITLASLALVVILAITSLLYYKSERKRIMNAQFHELAITNILKVNQIKSWRQYQLSKAQAYSSNPLFAETVKNFLNTNSNELKLKLAEHSRVINQYESYQDILVVNCKGNVKFSMNPEFTELDSVTVLLLEKVLNSKLAAFSNISTCSSDNKLYVDIISPVITSKNELTGALILRTNPYPELVSKLGNDPEVENSTESLLVFEKNKQLFALNNKPDSKGSPAIKKIESSHPLYGLISKKLNQPTGIDLLNERVIAHLHQIPETSWFILTQIKYDIVLASFHSFAIFDTIVTGILIILLLTSITLIYKYRQKEIYTSLLGAELALKEERERFRTTLYSTGDGVITTDNLGIVMNINSEASRLTGWLEKGAVGRHVDDIYFVVNEDSRLRSENPVSRVLKEGVMISSANHSTLVALNGNEYPVSESGAPIRNENNEIIGVVLVFRDQTKQRSAEKQLKKSEANLRKAEYVSKSGHWELSLLNKSVTISEGTMYITGLQSKVYSFDDLSKLALPENQKVFNSVLELFVNGTKSLDFELRILNQLNNKIVYLHLIADYNASVNKVFGTVQDITEYKNILKDLNESRLFLEIAQDISKVGSWLYDEATHKTTWSKEMYRIFDRNPLLGEPSWNEHSLCIHPEDRRMVNAALLAAFKYGSPYNFECRILNTRGEVLWVKTIGKALPGSNGKIEKLFGTVQDISKRKKSEEALFLSKERWQNLFDNSPSAIAVYEAVDNGNDFVFTDFNNTAQQTESYKREQVIGKQLSLLFPKAEELGFLNIFRKVWRTGETEYVSPSHYVDNERDAWRENIIYKLKTGEVVAIYNDVTERMRAELQLIASEKKFRLLFESVADPILLVDLDGYILEANPVTCNLLGYTLEELKKLKTIELNTEEYKPKVIERFKVLSDQGALFFETAHYSKTGGILDFEVNSRIIDYENRPVILSVYRDITKRKDAENALRESEEKFRNLFENHSAVKMLIDPLTWQIVDANNAAANFYGWTLDELKGIKIQQINALSAEELEKKMVDVLNHSQIQFEFKHRLKNGDSKDVEVYTSLININNKQYLHSIIHDISKRKKAELALVESEYFLRKSQEVGKVGSYRLDISSGNWTGSKKSFEILGIEKENKNDTKSWLEVIHPEFKTEIIDYYKIQTVKLKNRFDKEYKIIRPKDKRERWVHGVGEIEIDKYGNPVAVFGTILDITERKLSELAIIQNEKRLQLLLNSVTDYIYSVRIENGKIVESKHGEGCKTITGYSGVEFSTDPDLWISITYHADKNSVKEHLFKVLNESDIKPIEHRIVRKDGRVIWIRNTPVLNHDKNGNLTGYEGLISEITERKSLEQKILTSVVETEEQERLVFSQELHDGLGPLISAIKMYIELLSMPNSKADTRNFLNNAERLVEEASLSIREISFKLSPHILQNYGIKEALKAYAEKVQKTRIIDIRLNCNITCRLAAITETIIYRVICECINNTLKHAKATTIDMDLHCINNETLDIVYADNGQGFDVERALKEHKGVGLLNMKSRIKSINGDMQIKSQPGEGTQIIIRVKTLVED